MDVTFSPTTPCELTEEFIMLYTTAFPPEERRDWEKTADVRRFMLDNHSEFNIIMIRTDNCFAGFITYWDFNDFIYIEHFAVHENFRKHGIGSKTLSHIISKINRNIILEVEHPNNDESTRRIKFYLRAGFHVNYNIDYIQPPYHECQSSVPLLLMTYGNIFLSGIDDPKIELIKRKVYGI